uniref:Uncharacterized protein n=1 Tax=Guillardia theta TaxID=55529 RepID=A0A7S4NV99_GUITH
MLEEENQRLHDRNKRLQSVAVMKSEESLEVERRYQGQLKFWKDAAEAGAQCIATAAIESPVMLTPREASESSQDDLFSPRSASSNELHESYMKPTPTQMRDKQGGAENKHWATPSKARAALDEHDDSIEPDLYAQTLDLEQPDRSSPHPRASKGRDASRQEHSRIKTIKTRERKSPAIFLSPRTNDQPNFVAPSPIHHPVQRLNDSELSGKVINDQLMIQVLQTSEEEDRCPSPPCPSLCGGQVTRASDSPACRVSRPSGVGSAHESCTWIP